MDPKIATVMGLSLRSASENERYLVAKKGHPLRGFFEDFRYITLKILWAKEVF
jgi:hypothetical protein